MSSFSTAKYRAATQQTQAFGATPQEALAALLQHLPQGAPAPIVIWPYNQGDPYWTNAQQARLQDLKTRQAALTPGEHAELDDLIAASFDATLTRLHWLRLGLYP